jgi:hypothetical protein
VLLTNQRIQSPMKLDSLARQQKQLVLKAVDILREITEEAVCPSETIKKVVKLGGFGLRLQLRPELLQKSGTTRVY